MKERDNNIYYVFGSLYIAVILQHLSSETNENLWCMIRVPMMMDLICDLGEH